MGFRRICRRSCCSAGFSEMHYRKVKPTLLKQACIFNTGSQRGAHFHVMATRYVCSRNHEYMSICRSVSM